MSRWFGMGLGWALLFPVLMQAQEIDEIIEEVVPDSLYTETSWERDRYLEEGYYDSIAIAQAYNGETGQAFWEMLPKYQTEEFSYSESITSKLSFLERIRLRLWRFIDEYFPKQSWFSEEDFYNLLAVLGLILILYLCYHFFIGKHKIYTHIKREQREQEEIAFVERNLMDVDVQNYIAEAVKKKDYALAIRYQQLLNIQVVNKKGLIEWDYTKTNVELMEDVKNDELRKAFLACASVFDRVWFGDFKIDEHGYRGIVLQFEHFQKRWS